MYSKDTGITHRTLSYPRGVSPSGRTPSYRQSRAERVQVPPNYSGHAIVDGEERPLGIVEDTPPDRPVDGIPPADTPVPRFDGLPRVSLLGDSRHRQPLTYSADPASFAEVTESPATAYNGENSDGASYGENPHQSPPAPLKHHKTAPNTIQHREPPSTAPHHHESPPNATYPLPSPPASTDPARSHGILSLGLEELLLLGLILFLLREGGECPDRGDLDETVVLLGLLLLLG